MGHMISIVMEIMSRLPIHQEVVTEPQYGKPVFFSMVVTGHTIGEETLHYPVLSKVLEHVQAGWTRTSDAELTPFVNRQL